MDRYKLQYGNNTLTYPSWNGYLEYTSNPFYNLTLQTDGHGTLTADTLTGYPEDTSILSYTANSNYAFSGYSIEGGGSIQNNTYTFGNEDGIVKAWFSAIPTSGIVYTNDAELGGNDVWSIPKTNVPSGNYIVISYDSKGASNNGAATHYNRFYYGSSEVNWNRRHHSVVGNYMILVSNRAFNKTNDSVKNRETNNYWYTNAYNHTGYHKFKLICQKSNGACSAFAENNYMGYGTLGVSNLTAASLWLHREATDTPYTKNRRIAWFNNLSDAVSWYG